MRLKITRRLSGSIDGLQLAHFETGEVYDVGTSLGSYLLALGAAEPVVDETPRSLPTAAGISAPRELSHPSPPARAADRSSRRR